MKQIKAPNNTNYFNRNRYTKIFLAGSIENGTAKDWQKEAVNIFQKEEHKFNKEPVLINPRRDDWNSSLVMEYTNPEAYQQVMWEVNNLDNVDYILMYFAAGTYSPISLLELGIYIHSNKLHVICEDGYRSKANVDIVCGIYHIPQYNSLADAVEGIILSQ